MLDVNKRVNQITVNGMGPCRKYHFINTITPNAHILYSLKQKNLSFSDVFREQKKGLLGPNGLIG